MYKAEGVLILVKDTVQVTEKFKKREFVIEDSSSMYPQEIIFQSVQDKCDMLDGYDEGQNVEVSFNLRGRAWESPQGETKYFNTLDAWRIEVKEAMAHGIPTPKEDIPPEPQGEAKDSDDLPF